MAQTKINEPTQYQTLWHNMMFLLSSTESGQNNFKYSFLITVGAESRTVRISPRPVDQRGEFDISNHLQDFLDIDDFDLPVSLGSTVAPSVPYTVSVTEEWIDGLGVPQTGTTENYTLKHGTNIVLDRVEVLEYNDAFYHVDNTGATSLAKILLNTEHRANVFVDDFIYLHVVGLVDTPILSTKITEFNSSGGIITTQTILGGTFDALSRARYIKLDLSTVVFNTLTKTIGIELIDGDTPINILTEQKILTLKTRPCGIYTQHRFFYQDKEGSYNAFSFDFISSSKTRTKPQNYRKRIDALNQNSRSRGTTQYSQDAFEEFTVNSDNLEFNQITQVEDLILSDRVLLDVRNDPSWSLQNFVPVEITTSRVLKPRYGNQEIPQYQLKYKYAFPKITR